MIWANALDGNAMDAECTKDNFIFHILKNGTMGVDMFFVLSGFLISFILYKECQKYEGQIDFCHFLRNRFLRLWPVMFVVMLPMILIAFKTFGSYAGIWSMSCLAFMNNLLGYPIENESLFGAHLWSTACEF